MSSDSDLDELHNSILSMCEENTIVEVPDADGKPSELGNQMKENQPQDFSSVSLCLSPIKQQASSDPSTPFLSNIKFPVDSSAFSLPVFTPHAKAESEKDFMKLRAHSTPLVPKSFFSGQMSQKRKIAETIVEENEEDADLKEMTYDDLLSEVTLLCGGNPLLNTEGPPKISMDESVKAVNQTQVSKINIDSILMQPFQNRDENLDKSSDSISSETSVKEPGRFTGLDMSERMTIIVEDDEDVEFSEDILGLDEFIYSELDSDEEIDEKTLLSEGEETVVHDKTVAQKDAKDFSCQKEDNILKEKDEIKKLDNRSVIATDREKLDEKDECQNENDTLYLTDNESVDEFLKQEGFFVIDSTSRDKSVSEKGDKPEVKVDVKNIKSHDKVVEDRQVIKKMSGSTGDANNLDKHVDKESPKQNNISIKDKENKLPTISVTPIVRNEQTVEKDQNGNVKSQEKDIIKEINYKVERDFLKNENHLMKEIMKKWNSKGIQNPDTNLTCATRFRKKHKGKRKGRLEGVKLCTLAEEEKSCEPEMKKMCKNTQFQSDVIMNLNRQIKELEHSRHNKLHEVYQDHLKDMERMQNRHRMRVRNLRIQQEMEIRSVHMQYSDIVFKQCQLMRLKVDHKCQLGHIQCVALNEEGEVKRDYRRRVDEENERFDYQYNQLTSLIQQLNRSESSEKDNQFGPHVMVELIKAPCRSNNETKSSVSVCLPSDIARAIMREDEVYERFYEY